MKILFSILFSISILFSTSIEEKMNKTEFVKTIKTYRCTINRIIDYSKNETRQLKSRDVLISYINDDTTYLTLLDTRGALNGSSPDLFKGEKMGDSFSFEALDKSTMILIPQDPTKNAILLQYGKIKNTPLFFVTRSCTKYN